MTLVRRLQKLELEFLPKAKVVGCNPTVFIVVPENMQEGAFDSDSYKPPQDEVEEYLAQLKDRGLCRDCTGSCGIDWSPSGFTNFSHVGESSSLTGERHIHLMFCANAEIPELTRRVMNGERTGQM
jgi:hypothetical protein